MRLATLFRRPAEPSVEPRWSSAVRSHVGLRRRINEDRVLDRGDAGLWAVADGMGGHAAGDVAAQIATDALRDAADRMPTPATVADSLRHASRSIHSSAGGGAGATSGTTVVALHAAGGVATLLWVGDSRGYRWRDGTLRQLTRDHSLVQTLVDRGALHADEAEHHPHANVVTRALGVAGTVAVDTVTSDVLPDDLFLLCSDGLSKACRPAELADLLDRGGTPDAIAEALVAAALVRDGSDNISVAVMRAG